MVNTISSAQAYLIVFLGAAVENTLFFRKSERYIIKSV